jgi:E3 ubiquitin-protein ligase HECTD3
LAHTEERAGEGQLWEVSLRGGGTAAFTDTTDVGGHFRTSIRTMCEDLITTPPSQVSSSETALPLFVHTTNFVRGAGDGEDAAELYLPNPRCTSDDYLERYRFVGVMCGASARFTAFMNIDLSSLCWKYILGETIATQDLRAVDVITAELIESVVAIDDETTWTLRQQDDYDEPIRWCVQLPRKAAALALRGDGTALVSFADREEYCALVKEVWLSQFSSQLNAVAQGFYSVFPQIGARLLTWRELERRVCGLPDVDVSQLKRIARYEGSYSRVSHRLMPVLH